MELFAKENPSLSLCNRGIPILPPLIHNIYYPLFLYQDENVFNCKIFPPLFTFFLSLSPYAALTCFHFIQFPFSVRSQLLFFGTTIFTLSLLYLQWKNRANSLLLSFPFENSLISLYFFYHFHHWQIYFLSFSLSLIE